MRSRRRLLGLLLLLLTGFCPEAKAAEWTPFAQDQAFTHLYDKRSIFHPSEEIVRVAVRVDPKGKEGRDFLFKLRRQIGMSVEGYENYGYSVTIIEIDCSQNLKRVLQNDDFNQKGELLDTVVSPNQKWAEIHSDSMHSLYRKKFCK